MWQERPGSKGKLCLFDHCEEAAKEEDKKKRQVRANVISFSERNEKKEIGKDMSRRSYLCSPILGLN